MPQLGLMFIVLTYFVIVGTSNAVNLTDGLDGLAIMPTVMVAGGFAFVAWATGNVELRELPAHSLRALHLRAGDRLYRHRRGRVWGSSGSTPIRPRSSCGDVGSLALGGALGTIAVLVRQEFLLVIMGGVS